MTKKVKSSWATNLQKSVDLKITKKLKNKAEVTQTLRAHISNAESIIRNIVRANQSKRIFQIIIEWVDKISSVPVEKIRDVLYNIEQFKADALIQPQIKANRQKQNGPAPIGAGAAA